MLKLTEVGRIPITLEYDNISYLNNSNDTELALDLLAITEESRNEAIVYMIIFVLAVTGNVPVFISLLIKRRRRSRIDNMILHLTIADLIVTFVMIPLEISWRITVEWLAGDPLCRLMLLIRAFGPYLSSMILVCISLDRYTAIVHPLRVNDARQRAKIMLYMAWATSFLCSVPQSIIFHVESHPVQQTFRQCVSFNVFTYEYLKVTYNIFCVVVLYVAPLAVIGFCYSRILWELWKRSKRTNNTPNESHSRVHRRRLCQLRLSDVSRVNRARARTLKMTIVIVVTFICCWTPYVVIHLWYLFDSKSAEALDSRIQSPLFMFAVSNSCLNPLVYGSYSFDFLAFIRNICGICPKRTIRGVNPIASVERKKIVTTGGGFQLYPTGEAFLELKHATPVRRPINQRKNFDVDTDDYDNGERLSSSHSCSDCSHRS